MDEIIQEMFAFPYPSLVLNDFPFVCLFVLACEVTFENTKVPIGNVIGEVGDGFKVITQHHTEQHVAVFKTCHVERITVLGFTCYRIICLCLRRLL